MFNMQRFSELRTIAQDPTESEYVQALVTILSTLEHRQLKAVEGLHDALDIEGIEVQADQEDRRDQLLELVDAVASGEFETFWFENVVGEHIENAEDARAYAGLDEDEWSNQIETWAKTYRSKASEEFEDKTDREVAAFHVVRKFGVSLPEFEREVVNYERREALRTVLAGNFEAVENGIQAATAEVEQATEGGEDDGE